MKITKKVATLTIFTCSINDTHKVGSLCQTHDCGMPALYLLSINNDIELAKDLPFCRRCVEALARAYGIDSLTD